MCISFLAKTVKNKLKLPSTILLAILLSISSIQSANAYSKPRYSSVIIDVNNGRTIHASNATAARYPASLTKIMTLYMLFSELKKGKVKKWTRLPVSTHATRQEPSSLGLKKGQWITVDDAIKALVTKSANDVAVVIAEYIGGTEGRFAQKMTSTAHALGMKRTTFKNASGLPNKAQVTTAKDMAILGIKIQAHFPVYFKYFKTRSFKYKGRVYGNHNKLLGRYKGVDGIKTGYTRASGFNLVSSVKHKGKNVVAVVIGGKTGASRDAHMRQLLNKAMPKLATRRTTPKTRPRIVVANAPKPKKPVFAAPTTPVLAFTSKNTRLTARMTPMPKMLQNLTSTDVAVNNRKQDNSAPVRAPVIVASNGKVKKDESRINFAAANGNSSLPLGFTPTLSRTHKTNLSPVGQKIIAIASSRFILKQKPKTIAKTKAPIVTASTFKAGWAVQVGAYANPTDAKKQLDQLNKIMTPYDAQYYIPSVKKGSKSIYRARFAGLTKTYAKKACSAIKRKGYSCLALKNN